MHFGSLKGELKDKTTKRKSGLKYLEGVFEEGHVLYVVVPVPPLMQNRKQERERIGCFMIDEKV